MDDRLLWARMTSHTAFFLKRPSWPIPTQQEKTDDARCQQLIVHAAQAGRLDEYYIFYTSAAFRGCNDQKRPMKLPCSHTCCLQSPMSPEMPISHCAFSSPPVLIAEHRLFALCDSEIVNSLRNVQPLSMLPATWTPVCPSHFKVHGSFQAFVSGTTAVQGLAR